MVIDTGAVLSGVLTDIEKVNSEPPAERCKFYGYTPPGGSSAALQAALKLNALHYPFYTYSSNELMIANSGGPALRNIIRVLVDEREGTRDKVVIIDGKEAVPDVLNKLTPLMQDSGGQVISSAGIKGADIKKDEHVRVFADVRALEEQERADLFRALARNTNMVLVDVHEHEEIDAVTSGDNSFLDNIAFSHAASGLLPRIVTVDIDKKGVLPTVVSGSQDLIMRLNIRQMIASAGMSFVPQRMLVHAMEDRKAVVERPNGCRGEMRQDLFASRSRSIQTVPIRAILNLLTETEVEAGVTGVIPNASIGMPLHNSMCPDIAQAFLEQGVAVENLNFGDAEERRSGLSSTREQVAALCTKRYAQEFSADHALVTHGANGALYAALRALHEQDLDRTLFIIAPYFSSYKAIAMECGFRPEQIVAVKCKDDLSVDLDDLAGKLTSHDKVVLIENNPNNPTGMRRSSAQNEEIAGVLRQHRDLIIFNDDAYHSLGHDEDAGKYLPLTHFLSQTDCMRWVHGFSGSKELLGAPGARVGGLVADFELGDSTFVELARNVHDRDLGPVSPVAQRLFALGIDLTLQGKTTAYDSQRVQQYKANIDAVVQAAEKTAGRVNVVGLTKDVGTAAFYVIIELPRDLLGTKVPQQIGRPDCLGSGSASLIQGFADKVLGPKHEGDTLQSSLDVIKWMVLRGAGAMVPLDSFGVDDGRLLFRAALGGTEDKGKDLVSGLDAEVQTIQRLKGLSSSHEAVSRSGGLTGGVC